MRRLLLITALLLAHGAPALRAGQDRPVQDSRPLQADGVVRLLLDLENAVTSARVEDFRALGTAAMPETATNRFQIATRGGPGARAVIRERMRRPVGRDYDVVVDVLVSRGAVGRIATWVLVVTPDEGPGGTFKITDLKELAAIDGMIRLSLDTTRQFAVKDLLITAPDLQLKMSSGTAFVAESPNGVTAIVFRGKGDVLFTPPDPTEQVQLQIFDGKSRFSSTSDAFFVRLNPASYVMTVSEGSLVPMRLDPAEAAKAQAIFDDFAPRTYNIDLRTLTAEKWSIEPANGSIVAEVKTPRRGWVTYARSPADHEDISLFDRDDGRNIALYASSEKVSQRGRFYSEDDGESFDIEHYRLNLTFDPARLWVSGRASVVVRVMSGGLSSLQIKLAQQLAVASVSSPELGDLLALRVVGQNSILIGLPTYLEKGAKLTVDVVYGGRLEGQALDREAIEVQGVQQNPATPEDTRLTPEPRFLYSNRLPWYPQSGASDYATAEMRLSVPSEYQIVASGSLVSASVTPNKDVGRSGSKSIRTSEFRSDRPLRYLACVISRFVPLGRTRVDFTEGTGVNLEVVSTSRMVSKNKQTPQRVASMLGFYASTLGDMPYPDFTLAALDDVLPGGHSPAFFAVFHQPLPTTPYSWSGDPVAFEDTYPHLFLAHEVAHQWFGQAVGWKNYHEQWLSEGLAQYFAALYAADDRGPAMLQTLIAEMRQSTEPYLDQGPISLGYRLGHIKHDGRVFRAIVYNKSAVVLHMLRRLMGDEAFFGALRQFYTTWRYKKAGTQDIEAAFQAATTIKLDAFFDLWVRDFRQPKIRLTNESRESGATVRIEQLDQVFVFPLTISIQYMSGRVEERTIKVTDRIVDEPISEPVRRVTTRELLTPFEQVR